jgi:hypothetical protein
MLSGLAGSDPAAVLYASVDSDSYERRIKPRVFGAPTLPFRLSPILSLIRLSGGYQIRTYHGEAPAVPTSRQRVTIHAAVLTERILQ